HLAFMGICLRSQAPRRIKVGMRNQRVRYPLAQLFSDLEMVLMIALRRCPVVYALLVPLCLPAGVLRADTFSALAFDNATVRPDGPRSGTNGKVFVDIEGANNAGFA